MTAGGSVPPETSRSETTLPAGGPGGAEAGALAELARFARALAHPHRLRLLGLLAQGPRTVEALAGAAGLGVASASQHLGVLRRQRLVEAERHGLYVEYRLAGDDILNLWLELQKAAARHSRRLAELAREAAGLEAGGGGPPLEAAELAGRLGRVLLIDLRPAVEFAAGHLPGARSLPAEELAARPEALEELARQEGPAQAVAYCRGPYCFLGRSALPLLARRFPRVGLLAGGFAAWKAEGYPVERGAGTAG
ncbi:MAG: metalloregulator ArsR/SmtB family transcription factor [Bacillota bacterium]|nr:metalloregulator ArsR/SmtB family transcription factor [Bacillota bacterium]